MLGSSLSKGINQERDELKKLNTPSSTAIKKSPTQES